jgi:hypothetical protein
MNETYTQVGSDSSWIVAFMPVPAVITFSVLTWFNKAKRKPSAWLLVPVLYFLVAAVIGIPMEWIFAGACLGGAVATLMVKTTGNLLVRSIFAVIFLAISVQFTQMYRIGYSKIVLRDSQVRYDSIGRKDVAPRTGLAIHCIGPQKEPWDIRSWGSWTSFVGSGSTEKLGPSITGFSYFWGPHGLIRGDALGEHLAKWANVVPTYSHLDSK